MRKQTLAICQTIQANEVSNFRATSLETLRGMVAAGKNITLIPRLAQRKNDGLAYIPFNTPKPTRTIGLFWRNASPKHHVFEILIKLIKKQIDE